MSSGFTRHLCRKMKIITLNNDAQMPIIGLGTFKTQGRDVINNALDAALASGYRAIDTAGVYRNETDIGESLKVLLPKHGLKREDIFITSKLGPKDQGRGKCRRACLTSISNLSAGYLDLYLIHWPGTQGRKPDDPGNRQNRRESWEDLEELYREGKLKAIGVSNYEQRHLEELLGDCSVKPAVLQNEYHPHLVQHSLVKYCHGNGIHFQAYSSLGTMTDKNMVLTDPVVVQVAEKYKRTPAQILLRWAVQQEIGVIPKSTSAGHIAENMAIFSFTLTEADMDNISSRDQQHHYCWNPATVS